MASGHVNRTNRPNTWLHRPSLRVTIPLANPEPSTHGTFATSQERGSTSAFGGAKRTLRRHRRMTDFDPLRSYDELKFRSATHDLTLANPVCCHGVHG
jgi:hypothetical protein